MDADRLAWLQHPTRARMLAAAEQRFAAEGYDAARVDDIAAAAGVSKSHLYYHFASKGDLLAGLVDLRVGELLAAKDAVFGDLDLAATLRGDTRPGSRAENAPAGGAPGADVRPGGDPLAETLRRAIEELLVPRRDFIRIVLVEAIRNPDATRPVFAALDALLADTASRFAASGYVFDERARSLWLHFGIIPALYLVALDPTPGAADLASGLAGLERAVIPTLRRSNGQGSGTTG